MATPKPVTSWTHSVMDPLVWRPDLDEIVTTLNAAADEWHAKAVAAWKTERERVKRNVARMEDHRKAREADPSLPEKCETEPYRDLPDLWDSSSLLRDRPPSRPMVTIEDDETIFESLDEVQKLRGKNPASLRLYLTVSGRRAYIDLSHAHAYISVDGNEGLAALFNRLRSIVDRSGRTSYQAALLRVVVVGGLLTAGAISGIVGGWIGAPYSIMWGLAFALWGVNAVLSLRDRHVSLVRRRGAWMISPEDEPAFWRKNRNEIIVGVLMLIVGAVLTKMVGVFWP